MKLFAKVKQEQQPLKSFFVSKSRSAAAHVESAGGVTHESLTVPDPPATDPPNASTSTGGATMTKYVAKDDVRATEVLWAVKMVMSHYSANSCSKTGDLFKQMFPDSRIAHNFNCGKTECSYLACFGLAPYFHDKLISNLRLKWCGVWHFLWWIIEQSSEVWRKWMWSFTFGIIKKIKCAVDTLTQDF